MSINARQPGESFDDYKARRKNQNGLFKRYLREGAGLWNAMWQGTYIRAKHGPIGEQRDTKQQRRKHGG